MGHRTYYYNVSIHLKLICDVSIRFENCEPKQNAISILFLDK